MEKQKIIDSLKPYKQGMQINEVKQKYNLDNIVKLASNENPYGFSSLAKDAIVSSINDMELYPDGYAGALRSAVAEKIGVHENQLVFGSGSDDLIGLICRTYLYPGANTIMAAPTFGQYRQNVLVEGAKPKEIPLAGGSHDLKKMEQVIDENTEIIWLCSPNNPTGCAIEKQTLYDFLATIPSNITIVLDEAYYEFMDEEDKPHVEQKLGSFSNVIVLRTFSKAYGLAGLRIGYAVCSKENSNKLNAVRAAFNTSALAQRAALAALKDDAFLQATIKSNQSVRDSFQDFLDQLGWRYERSQTNFLLVHTPTSGDELFEYLLRKGFIVRSGEALGCPNTVRITIGKQEDMDELQKYLKQFNQEVKG
ncbi:histidinol-phosphate transaminase [Virgibacillus halophilus]|uniref:histidinol-phosphate transaminase n=1 Tax=Tigheibacillus halophilus TaxID=361280 RepID=UPI003627934D